MEDKGRSLEHLAQQVQRLTLIEVQKCFLSGDVDRGSDLLSQWEGYLELSKHERQNTQGNETLIATLKLLKKRLKALQDVLNILPRQQCVRDLVEKANSLEEKLASIKVGIGGGTFEWVDSVLVKCLKDGRWLAVDNVNLCSPAVLDRLNGLLEPGGELVVGERGVDKDGRLVTVKPHPDFRLFLIMDPHHGEISRAMRNRGVEICLLGPEENQMPFMDLQAILNHIGISQYNHQKVLLNIHEEMTNLSIGFESINTNHLLQVASLVVQQVLRGENLYLALRSACDEIYNQGRQLSTDQRQRCRAIIDEILDIQKPLLEAKPDVRDALDVRTATVNTLSLSENSALALLQQKSALLSAALQLLENREKCTLKDILKDDLQKSDLNVELFNKDIRDVLPHLLVTLFCFLSEKDLSLKHNCIVSTIMLCKDNEVRNKLLELEKLLASTVQQYLKIELPNRLEGVNRKDLCWDLRRVSSWISHSENFNNENKTIALLNYFMQHLRVGVIFGELKNKSVKSMSALDFSTAFNKGKVTTSSVRSQAVLQLSRFLEAVDCQVRRLLTPGVGPEPVDADQCCRLISGFLWFHHLVDVARRRLFVSHSREMEVDKCLLMWLHQHIHWVKKRLVFLLTSDTQLGSELRSLCSDVLLNGPLQSLSRRVRMLVGQPPPVTSQQEGLVSETVCRLENMIDLSNPDQQTKEAVLRKVDFLLSSKGKDWRLKLVQLLSPLSNDSEKVTDGIGTDFRRSILGTDTNVQEPVVPRTDSSLKFIVLEELNALESTLHEAKLDRVLSEEYKRDTESNDATWEVALWPIRGVICLHLMSAVGKGGSDQLTTALRSWMLDVPLFLPSVVASSEHQLIRQMALSVPARLWLSWYRVVQQKEEKINTDEFSADELCDTEKEVYPLHCPLLSLFTISLLYPQCHESTDHSMAVPPLHSYKQHARMLAALGEIIWNTAPGLASRNMDFRKNEVECVFKTYSSFIEESMTAIETALGKSTLHPQKADFLRVTRDILECKFLNVDLKPYEFGIEVDLFLSDLSRYLQSYEKNWEKLMSLDFDSGESDSAVILLLAGQAWTTAGLMQLVMFSHQDSVDPVERKALKLSYAEQETTEFESILAVEEAEALVLGVRHVPLRESLDQRLTQLEDEAARLRKYTAYRPTPNVYTNLYAEIQQLLVLTVRGGEGSGCGSHRVEATATALRDCLHEASDQAVREALARAESLLISLRMSEEILCKRYVVWYPDVVIPVTSAISQMRHGLTLMVGAVRKHVANQPSQAESLLMGLVRFPLPDREAALHLIDICTDVRTLETLAVDTLLQMRHGLTLMVGAVRKHVANQPSQLESLLMGLVRFPLPDREAALHLVDICTDVRTLGTLAAAVQPKLREGEAAPNETFRLAKCSLEEVRNLVSVAGELRRAESECLGGVLAHLVTTWPLVNMACCTDWPSAAWRR